jgi:hypothetical protein
MGYAKQLKVLHIPQVPGKAFEVSVDSVVQGVRVMKLLAKYDAFQYENNIKPDYCNASFLVMWDEENQEWEDWYDEETNEDDPVRHIANLINAEIDKL